MAYVPEQGRFETVAPSNTGTHVGRKGEKQDESATWNMKPCFRRFKNPNLQPQLRSQNEVSEHQNKALPPKLFSARPSVPRTHFWVRKLCTAAVYK